MIESTVFEEATAEKLAESDVVMAVGFGDSNAPTVLLGREQFVKAAKNQAIAAETKTLRVKVKTEQQLAKLIALVKDAKGELDPEVKEIEVLPEPEESEVSDEAQDEEEGDEVEDED